MDNDQSILESPAVKPRNILQSSYYESVVEQDLRLRMIRNTRPNSEDCGVIFKLDRKIAKVSNGVISHPIAIYLNKLAPKSKLSASVQKEKLASLSADEMMKLSSDHNKLNYRKIWKKGIMEQKKTTLDGMNIDLRKRWNKLYDRKPLFELQIQEILSTEILNKSTQIQNELSSKEPAQCWNADRVYRIYRRCKLEFQNEDQYFPLTWNKPVSSKVIDEVSGEALCHIALLCRDVICETNKCTTGCSLPNFSCGTCRLRALMDSSAIQNVCGSFAEGCMLPTFYVQNDKIGTIKIWSDVDYMVHPIGTVGFGNTESDIVAVIDTDNSPPGYLQLRDIRTRILCCRPEEKNNFDFLEPSTRKNKLENTMPLWNLSPHGPATKVTTCHDLFPCLSSFDSVNYYSCSSWPPIAKPWIDRERHCNWPSIETIQTVVSKGCRIVHTPKVLSQGEESVFRFSFSVAELILFETLSSDQKKCFIAFKAFIKYGISKLENEKDEINLSTYCLKIIFLWACETIPADVWQTTNGWSKCLLYMIDKLYSCVKCRNLPGYFIPEINLLDNLKRSRELLDEIEQLRSSPLSYAATFIDATKCFRGFYLNTTVAEESNILCSCAQKIKEDVLTDQLKFLIKIVRKSKETRCGIFWKKETVLRIFANWCKQNSCATGLAPWQCLTEDMTLFDVVYLDIVHGFDVPNNVLLEYLGRGYSAEFVCRLGYCYSYYRCEIEKHNREVKSSFHFKTLLMMLRVFVSAMTFIFVHISLSVILHVFLFAAF